MEELLKIENLSVGIKSPAGKVQAVRDVSFTLHPGEVLAIVGESGCGKSMLCKTIMKLLPKSAKIEGGKIWVNGVDITDYSDKDMRKLRGKLFSMIFQDPMTALNPTIPIGKQIAEAILVHDPKLPKEEVYNRVIELMELVGIQQPHERYKLYPYNFSGGMRQRSVMAIALAANPKILLADEPTTALDVTIEAQILEIISQLKNEFNTAVMMITHNFGLVAEVADRVAIMYAGELVEQGDVYEVFDNPIHPYTKLLMKALPRGSKHDGRLQTIYGSVPRLTEKKPGCRFANRCPMAQEVCFEQDPVVKGISATHTYRCHFAEEGV